MRYRNRAVIAIVLAFALLAAACGGGGDAADETTTTIPPLASTTTTQAMETTTTTAATVAFDLEAAVEAYDSTIPDGYMNIGDITAFKDAVAASDALLIDVRETGEYAEGHIEGAVNIPIRTLAQNLDKIPTDRQVFVYCASGWRAGMSVSSLRMLGYDNVLAFSPGWKGWTEAGEPASTDAVAAETVEPLEVAPELLAAVDDFLSTIPDGYYTAGDVEAVKEAQAAGAQLLDVRTDAEWAEGYIPGAIHVDLRTIAASMDEIPTDVPIIAYCKSGFRASLSVPILHVLGFDATKGFSGSYAAWTAANEPIETP